MRARARTCILRVLGGGLIKLAQLIAVHIKFTAHSVTREASGQETDGVVTDLPIVPLQGDSRSFTVTVKASIHHVALQTARKTRT